MKPYAVWCGIAIIGSVLMACQRIEEARVLTTAEQAVANAEFAESQKVWRQTRRDDLTKPDGWTALIGLHWIEPGPHYLGSAAENGIRLSKGPAHIGLLERKGSDIFLTPDAAANVFLDGTPLVGRALLTDDMSPAGASVLSFDEGKGQASIIKRSGRYALRVKHADAETRTGFVGLEYWPPDVAWRVDAKFIPHPAGKTIPVASIIGTVEPTPNPGILEFEHGGKSWRLEVLDEGEGLFLIFADRTSGHESYGAGRYLYPSQPDANGRVIVDFNRAYNPPCAFTVFATCPLPPPENRLDLAINAGEKTYAKTH